MRGISFRSALLASLVALAAALPAGAEQVMLTLPTGANLKAELQAPPGDPTTATKYPAVIYLHGAMVREAGIEAAADRGYDIAGFTRAFAGAGLVAIAPVRVTPVAADNGDDVIDEGLAAILGALEFLRARKDVDAARVSVAGFGEGGLIVLWAMSEMPDIARGVVMSPVRMSSGRSRAATRSLDALIDSGRLKSMRGTVLLTAGEKETRRALKTAEDTAQALMKSYRRFRYIRNYPAARRWFRQPRAAFMGDVVRFLKDGR